MNEAIGADDRADITTEKQSKAMAEKKAAAKKSAPAKPDPNTYRAEDGIDGIEKGMTDSQMMAALAARSSLSATTLKAYAGGGDTLEVTDLLCPQ